MAKKVVATLKTDGGVKMVKVIKSRKKGDSGGYTFKETLLPKPEVDDFLKKD